MEKCIKPRFFFAIDVINKDLGWGDTAFIQATSAEEAVKGVVRYLEEKSIKYNTQVGKWEMVDIRQISLGTYRRRKRRVFGSRKQLLKKEEVNEVLNGGLIPYDIREFNMLTGMLKKRLKL